MIELPLTESALSQRTRSITSLWNNKKREMFSGARARLAVIENSPWHGVRYNIRIHVYRALYFDGQIAEMLLQFPTLFRFDNKVNYLPDFLWPKIYRKWEKDDHQPIHMLTSVWSSRRWLEIRSRRQGLRIGRSTPWWRGESWAFSHLRKTCGGTLSPFLLPALSKNT